MISAVVLTKNEEKNIVDCLESLSFADEIIVLDDSSEDRTPEIAKKMGARTIRHALDNNFSKQRNFGLSKAENTWILFIDADERVTAELRNEILDFVKNSEDYAGVYIKRQDVMWDKVLKFGETGNRKFLRLAKRNSGKWIGRVHEEWNVYGEITTLNSSLIHYPHQSIAEFLKEINYYTDIRAQELYDKRIQVEWYSIILYPKIKFFQNYFLRLGFLDGLPGFIAAIIMSFHSFLVRGKLWFLWQRR